MIRRAQIQQASSAPQAASEEPQRRCFIPGIQDAAGEPVQVIMTGSTRRPVIQALASYATLLAAGRVIGGDA